MIRPTPLACGLALAGLLGGCAAPEPAPAAPEHQAVTTDRLEPHEWGTIERLHTHGGVFLASQPRPEDLELVRDEGLRTLINQRHASELDFDEAALAAELGLAYHTPAWSGVQELTDEILDRTRHLLRTAERPLMLHCSSANRVGAVWLAYRVLDDGLELEAALAEARQVGLRKAEYEQRVLEYVRARRAPGAPGTSGALDPAHREVRLEALDDELRAESLYSAVLAFERCARRPR